MAEKCSIDEDQACKMEGRIDDVVERFSRLAEKLTENQIEIRLNIVKLTENMHDMKRVHGRVDKVEEDIKKIAPLVYKMVGVATFLAVLIPAILTEYFMK